MNCLCSDEFHNVQVIGFHDVLTVLLMGGIISGVDFTKVMHCHLGDRTIEMVLLVPN